jgi:hypothetical protein
MAESKVDEKQFDEELRKIAVDHPDWRPFQCQGHPLAAQVFIIGQNPANPGLNNWWGYWDPITGFDYEKFDLDKWNKQDGESLTHKRLKRFFEGLGTDVNWLATNLYPVATKSSYITDGGTKHLDLLLEYCKPSHIVVCSALAWHKFFEPRVRKTLKISGGKFTEILWHSSKLYVTKQPAYGPSFNKFYALGQKISETLGRSQKPDAYTQNSSYNTNIIKRQEDLQMSTKYEVGEIVTYRGKTGRVVEARKNDKGYGVVRKEMNRRCKSGQWVSNLGTSGKGLPGDGGEMYRLEKV